LIVVWERGQRKLPKREQRKLPKREQRKLPKREQRKLPKREQRKLPKRGPPGRRCAVAQSLRNAEVEERSIHFADSLRK
jgi:hypothetical protein